MYWNRLTKDWTTLNINTTVDLPVAGNVVIVTIIQLIYFSIGSGSPKTPNQNQKIKEQKNMQQHQFLRGPPRGCGPHHQEKDTGSVSPGSGPPA